MSDLQKISADSEFAPDIKTVGAQSKYDDTNGDGVSDVFSVRFVGGIDILDYDEVGIEILPAVGANTADSPIVRSANTVYTSIMEEGNPVTAQEKGCRYFLAFIVDGIPLDAENTATITFAYRFYAKSGNTTYYSETATVMYGFDGVSVN